MKEMKRSVTMVLGGIIAAWIYSGCSAPVNDNALATPSTSVLDEHIVQSEELRYLMRSMNVVVHEEPQKSALEYDDARRRYALRLAGTIEEIAGEIERYPVEKALPESPKAVAKFKEYAEELYERGERIHQIAIAYEMEKLEPAINRMIRTCNACHRHFDAQATRIERGE